MVHASMRGGQACLRAALVAVIVVSGALALAAPATPAEPFDVTSRLANSTACCEKPRCVFVACAMNIVAMER